MGSAVESEKTVLLVEDNPSEANLIRRRIEEYHESINCAVSSDIDDALNRLFDPGKEDEIEPDLVLLDVYLRGESGFYLLSELKRHPSFKNIPVIVLTGTDREVEVQRGYRFGANAFVSKPENIEQFNRMIGSLTNFWLQNAKIPSGHSNITLGSLPSVRSPRRTEDGTLTVLLVEDNPGDRRTVERYLEGLSSVDVTCETAGTTKSARERLRVGDHDLILLDQKLPGDTGISFIGSLSGENSDPHLPIIMLTGKGDETLAARSIRAGAMDYIAKSELSQDVLEESLERVMDRFRTREAGYRWERQLTPETLTDTVTGLFNWDVFMRRLDEEINRTRRYESYFSLLALKVVGFEDFRTEYSSSQLDEYLEEVSKVMIENLRESDIASRKDGDHFWLISPGTRAHEARLLALRLNQELEAGIRLADEGTELTSTFYAGIRSVNPSKNEISEVVTSHMLIEDAKGALRAAASDKTMNVLSARAR
ncbi:MAG: response regulator [bacterium]